MQGLRLGPIIGPVRGAGDDSPLDTPGGAAPTLQSMTQSPSPGVLRSIANGLQLTLTGTLSDASVSDVTSQGTFVADDTSRSTVSSPGGLVSYANGGKIYGGQLGVSASIGAVTSNSLVRVIPADSGSQYMPQRDSDWTDLGLSPWGAYGGCQESTGSIVLSGSVPYTLTPVNIATFPGLQYGQSIPGMTRLGVSLSGVNGQRVAAAAGVGPNPATDSMALLCYAFVGPSAVSSQFFGLGAAAGASRLIMSADSNNSSTGQVDMSFNGILKRLVGPFTNEHDDRVHPYLIVYNKTTAEVWGFTDQGLAVSGSSLAQVDGTKMFGANNNVCSSGTMIYWASCTGSVAESYASVTGGGGLLQSLGWNVPWLNCTADSGTIRCPITPKCWQTIGLNPWTATYSLQDTTGSSFSFDSWAGTSLGGWTLAPSLNVTYRNPRPGWIKRSLDIAEITSARQSTANNLIGSYTGSVAFMGYSMINATAGSNRSLFGGWATPLGGQFRVQYGAAGVPQLNCSGTVTTGLNSHVDGRVHPFLAVYDVTNSRAKLYTDIEAITGSFGVLNVTPNIGIGAISSGQVAASSSNVFFAVCTGSVATSLSDDGRASLFLKTLGWNPPW